MIGKKDHSKSLSNTQILSVTVERPDNSGPIFITKQLNKSF